MAQVVSILWSVVSFLVVIGLAIMIHEGGHFLAARFFGIRVHVFSLGFGRPIFSFERGGTTYQIAAIPVGGYVKMAGEDPGEKRTGARYEFASKSPWVRMAVVFAGPFFNIVSALLIMIPVFWIGLPSTYHQPVVGRVFDHTGQEIAIDQITEDQLQGGDRILSVDGVPTAIWPEVDELFEKASRSEQTESVVVVERGGDEIALTLPLANEEDVRYYAGFIPPVIGSVKWGEPAYKAGLQEGDQILAVNGEAIAQWHELTSMIHESPGETVTLLIARGADQWTQEILPQVELLPDMEGNQRAYGMIGIVPVVYTQSYGFTEGIVRGARYTWRMGSFVLSVLKRLVTGDLSLRTLAGPIGIAQMTGDSARQGLINLAVFTAFLSVNLGILNLLPFPVLDGGWILIFLAYEILRGRPMPEKWQLRLIQAGWTLLLIMIVVATYNDIARALGLHVVE